LAIGQGGVDAGDGKAGVSAGRSPRIASIASRNDDLISTMSSRPSPATRLVPPKLARREGGSVARSLGRDPYSQSVAICDPLTFSGTPIRDYRAPPLLGADTRDVLATIGYDDAELEALEKRKII
jgi:crotonobetainyl-CoA:carnitine CoA-transferase CaiB-like acyl-CoA transferase